MRRACFVFGVVLSLALSSAHGNDWPQWRGPNRTGVATSSPPLAAQWPREGPAVLWEGEEIPGHRDGGLGSVSVAGGKAFLYSLWHRDEPIDHRVLDDGGLRGLGWDRNMPTGDLLARVEQARTSDARKALTSGGDIRDFAREFVESSDS